MPDYRDVHDVPVPKYSDIEHDTWALLIEYQKKVFPNRAYNEFMEGLGKIGFPDKDFFHFLAESGREE